MQLIKRSSDLIKYISASLSSLFSHKGLHRYSKNISWVFFEQILRLSSGLLVGIWVARFLGPLQYGIFNYVLAYVSIFSIIPKLGLDSLVVRDLVNSSESKDILGTAFWMKFSCSITTFIFVIILAQFGHNDFETKLYISIIALGMIFQSSDVIDFYFQSKVLSRFVSLCKISNLIIFSIVRLCLIFIGAELLWFVIFTLIEQLFLGITLFFVYLNQKGDVFYRSFKYSIAFRLLREGWPFILSGLAIIVYMRIDQIMIKQLLGDREVGLFSVAAKLSEFWYFVPVIVASSFFPAIVNAKKQDSDQYIRRLQWMMTFLLWIAILIAVAVSFFGKLIVVSLFGADYIDAVPVLLIHVWSGLFVAMGVSSGYWYTLENLHKYLFYRTILGAIINVLLNILLIPKYGIEGSALATIAAQGLAAFIFDSFSKKTRPMFIMKLKALFIFTLIKKA